MKILRDTLAFLSLITSIVYVAWCWPAIPSIIPNHFGVDGQPNRFAPKIILWFIPAISVVIYILLTVVRRLPRLFNLPSSVDELDRLRQEALAVELIAWLRLEVAVLFAYLVWSIIHVAKRQAEDIGTTFLFAPLVIIAATSAYYIVRMKQPPNARQSIRRL